MSTSSPVRRSHVSTRARRLGRRCALIPFPCRLDAAGNLTGDGLRVFSYNAAGRLSQTSVSDADEGSKVTYLHNALGQRVLKSEPMVDHTAPSAATLGADFVGWLLNKFGWLFAQAQANATLGQSYVYGDPSTGSAPVPVLLGEYGNGSSQSAGRIEYIWLPTEGGQAIPIGQFKGERLYAVQSDHLGSPRKMTDDSKQTVWQWPYSAFGEEKPSRRLGTCTGCSFGYTYDPVSGKYFMNGFSDELNLRFPGQYFDSETGLSYNYFRSYQPSQGRYTQADPIGLEGGLNRFAYVEGNPLSFTDPFGLCQCTAIDGTKEAFKFDKWIGDERLVKGDYQCNGGCQGSCRIFVGESGCF